MEATEAEVADTEATAMAAAVVVDSRPTQWEVD